MCNLESIRKVASENSVGKFEFYLQAATLFSSLLENAWSRIDNIT